MPTADGRFLGIRVPWLPKSMTACPQCGSTHKQAMLKPCAAAELPNGEGAHTWHGTNSSKGATGQEASGGSREPDAGSTPAASIVRVEDVIEGIHQEGREHPDTAESDVEPEDWGHEDCSVCEKARWG